ncbi:hypothetical protein [Sphingobium cloacae]|uniref:hypothetical protein n=2 Tax=Sphingobium cloacae TaxID=120107 RepID=UPI000BBB397B|nr:hypothetical protein [Sphingobium cloacae]
MQTFLVLLYPLALVGIGWALWGLRWHWALRLLALLAVVSIAPAFFILPTVLRPPQGFDDLARAIGWMALGVGGAACFAGIGLRCCMRAQRR